MIFDYPVSRNERRHGPQGYSQYEQYRPWLRDEFAFRCVYCLKREQWGQVTAEFELDHFEPQAIRPDLATTYENLVYACRRCNNVKRSQRVDDPFIIATEDHLRVLATGDLLATSDDAMRLVRVLDLNSGRMVDWRVLWMRIVELARKNDSALHRNLVKFPDRLPRLDRLDPPDGNSRPDGVSKSWATLAEEGELPKVY